MTRFFIPLAALFLASFPASFLAPAAQAAMLDYTVSAVFEGDYVLELGDPDDNTCLYGEVCYPVDYRLPAAAGGLFSHLTPGEVVTATFSFDPSIDVGVSCVIAGWSDCGDFMGAASYAPATGQIKADWLDIFVVSATTLDLFTGTIGYEGEAGSYRMSDCDLSDPRYTGLPSGFCDFYGYGASFSVDSFDVAGPPLVSAPIPATLPLSLAALGTLAGFGRRRRA